MKRILMSMKHILYVTRNGDEWQQVTEVSVFCYTFWFLYGFRGQKLIGNLIDHLISICFFSILP